MPEWGFKRSARVGQLLQQELGSLLIEGVKDPRVGFVTVTEVRLSDNLRNARVFVSIYGTEAERRTSLEGLQDSAGYLKRELGKRVRLKYTPTLTFCHDDTLDRAERLDTIFDAIHHGETEAPDSSDRPLVPVQTDRSAREAARKTVERIEQVTQSKPPARGTRRRPAQRRRRRK